MDEHRKNAYRYLLHWAMLDIRMNAWSRLRWLVWHPLHWRAELRRVRYSGDLADALHNLALFASLDFERFDEERFWGDFAGVEKRYPEFHPSRFRSVFEERLSQAHAAGAES